MKEIAASKPVIVTDKENLKITPVENVSIRDAKYWRKIAGRCLFALGFMILGHVIASFYPLTNLFNAFKVFAVSLDLDAAFGWMLLAGFIAQMVDGALGMGYGVISTTVLLSTGLNPAAISGSIHTAEMFSSGASGFSHYKFGNINKKLFKTLLLPGVLGAVIGATLLVYLGEAYGSWLRPVLSVYTLLLGARILLNAFKKRNESRKVKHAGWLAGAGGFLDSFGGGGWGPLVTSTLIAKGKTPRYIIGTVSLTEFFVTLGSALTFFVLLGTSHIQTIAGLIIGGLLAAPIAARLAGKLNTKTILILVGVLVIISSARTLLKATGIL
ncbi:sulfite exporter TauE/SafE family protein [Pedobacter sp. MC2016-14]|uniref:sulfite exporter TauE/SafE family protein n=1 Tax=Pedobacter sp. MC2016-14 TaxID=2897327 RepID=UPI001E5E08C9|nr:sulfite exporter TauE/SafE family protein [Pedobacter sp. MC2016-14]MCD0488693.1 sulfite exporter TauE/SafE family protein [Pedobacter sp. MC2016-14]